MQVGTIEVVLDENGVARKVPNGKGTHLIKIHPDKETHMERKPPVKPSELSHLSRPEAMYYPAKGPMLSHNSSQVTVVEENSNEKAVTA